MVVKAVLQKYTKSEAKDLMEKGQKIIDEKIKGPALKEKKEKQERIPKALKDPLDLGKVDIEEGLKPKKLKKPSIVSEDKTEKLLFRKDSKITPTQLDDFNIDKFDTRESIIQFIDEISKQFKTGINKQKRGVQTNEATKEMASILQINSQKLGETLLTLKPGQTLNAETILAARELLVASLSKLDDLAIKAKTGGIDDIMNFRQHYALSAELQKIIKGVQTETGRALQQFKIPVREKNFTTPDINDLNRQQLMAELGGEGEIRELAKAYLKLDTPEARAIVNERTGFINNLSKASEAMSEVFINAILSNPMTHIRNTGGNWLTQGILMQERKLAARMFGDATKGGISEFEEVAKAYGRSMASQEMWGAIGRSLMDGKMPNIKNQFGGSKVEIRPGKFTASNFNLKEGKGFASSVIGNNPMTLANGVDVLGKILTLNRIPTRLLTVADSYFKNLEYRSEIYANAYRETVKAVRLGKIPKEKGPELLADYVVNPSSQTVKTAYEKTLASVYQTPLGQRGDFLDKGKFLQKWKSQSGPANVLLNYYLPFIQTPANITGFALERTPVFNLLLENYRNSLFGKNGVAAAQEAKTKMALGFMLYGAVAGFNIYEPFGMSTTGSSPEIGSRFSNKFNKTEIKNTLGIQSGTINFPNGFQINMTGYDPVAMYIRQATDFAAIAQMGFEDNDQIEDYISHFTAFLLATGENITSSTFMAGIGKAFNDYQSFDRLGLKKGGQKFANQFASSFVPTIARQGTKLFSDDQQKIAVSFDEYFTRAFNRNNQPNKYDRLGDPIEKFGFFSKRKEGPLRDELRTSGVELEPIGKKFTYRKKGLSADLEYTAEELSFLQKRSGEYAQDIFSQVMTKDEYKMMTAKQDNIFKQQVIKKIFSGAEKAAKADLLFNQENKYPKNVLDHEQLNIKVKSRGAYEKSNELLFKAESEIRKDFLNVITTQNLGQPNKMTDDEYFKQEE
ncbi:hypothetical protein OAM14_03705 [Candidatus Pelagibacter sp.]|nr:hypothetical protein [Candidatus Pelagibacter sp.]